MAQLRALVTGVTGQDGSYLSNFLLEKGYEVRGFLRRGSRPRDERVAPHYGDLTDSAELRQAIIDADPSEIYNLGAQSHVGASFHSAQYTSRATFEPLLTILEFVLKEKKSIRVYQASSSEMFGTEVPPQNEDTPFSPQSPYAIAKCGAHQLVRLYRKYGVYVVGGILFNHESPIRPPSFVTRKISQGVARIFTGKQSELVLGNLDARRDWGFAGDYVDAMWRMLQQDTPKDYVIATGETFSVRDFVELAFRAAEDITGKHLDWEKLVRVDAKYTRPAEVPDLQGDATRALADLGWQPTVRFHELVRMMVEHDLKNATEL
jgi:GDPmannose 4,6-dehydratase